MLVKECAATRFIKLTSISNGPREEDLTAQFIYIQYKKRLDNSSPDTFVLSVQNLEINWCFLFIDVTLMSSGDPG